MFLVVKLFAYYGRRPRTMHLDFGLFLSESMHISPILYMAVYRMR